MNRPTVIAALAATALLAACSNAATSAAPRASGNSCPDVIVSQLSWFPDPTHAAFLTPIAGGAYTVDDKKLAVIGQVNIDGVDKPVTWEVRAGGPAKGGVTIAGLMYADRSILLGQQATEEQINAAGKQPTVAVLAPLDGDPVIFAWDSAAHPEFNSVGDVGQTDTKVLAYKSPSTEYLVGAGVLRASQMDYSYDLSRVVGPRSRFVVAGFSTGLPYTLEHFFRWDPKTLLYGDVGTGYPNYRNLVTIRRDYEERYSWCLSRVVPMMQRAQIAFMEKPDPTLRMVADLNKRWKNQEQWPIDKGHQAVTVMRKDALVSNGSTPTFGDIDESRFRKMISVLTPLFKGQGVMVPDLTPADLFTNKYVDANITMTTD